MRALLLLLACSCGRIEFDARDASADAPVDVMPGGPDPSLVLHFTFDEGVTHDSGSGVDATCTSCPGTEPGPRGGLAGSFTGTECLHVSAQTFTPAVFTFAAWSHTTRTSDANIVGRPFDGATSQANSWEAYVSLTGTSFTAVVENEPATLPRSDTGWHHVAGVFDGTALRIYVDGVAGPLSTSVGGVTYASDDILVGCDIDFNVEANRFVGGIDDVRLYDRALDAQEIAALAQ